MMPAPWPQAAVKRGYFVAGKMTAAQIAESEQRAKAWRPKKSTPASSN